MNDMYKGIPPGYVALPGAGFTEVNGPLYVCRTNEKLNFGIRVEPRHANVMGTCHGAMLMLLADMQLPLAAHYQAGLDDRFLPTVNLTADFLASPAVGDWIWGETEVVRVTRNLVFTQGLFRVGDKPVLRANGIFKRTGPAAQGDGRLDVTQMLASLPLS
jgi:acyl-coenzyme A thioesterase PaaI-like protein